MAFREFTDSKGVVWRAWDVSTEVLHPVPRGEDFMGDLRDGVISPDVARDVYRVVFDEELGTVDVAATDEQRSAARQERLSRGKPFAAFVEEWSQLRPSEDKLTYYGSWPEPNVETYTKPFWGLFE